VNPTDLHELSITIDEVDALLGAGTVVSCV